jgi:hypothetical protein
MAMKVKLILQGRTESFEEYENRINDFLKIIGEGIKIQEALGSKVIQPIVVPSASSDGRMCCVLNYDSHAS